MVEWGATMGAGGGGLCPPPSYIVKKCPGARHRSSLDLFEFRAVTSDEVRTIILNSPSNVENIDELFEGLSGKIF